MENKYIISYHIISYHINSYHIKMGSGQDILQMVPIAVLLLLRAAVASWLARKYVNPQVWADCVFSWCKNQALNIRNSSWFGLSLTNLGDIHDWRGWNRHYRCISGIGLGLQWKLRTLDKPFGFLVFKPYGVRFAEVSFRNYLVD